MRKLSCRPVQITLWATVAIAGAIVSGCALFGSGLADQVADAVGEYCKQPYAARLIVRETVNAALAADGHSIVLTCAGDVAP